VQSFAVHQVGTAKGTHRLQYVSLRQFAAALVQSELCSPKLVDPKIQSSKVAVCVDFCCYALLLHF
jgi:hypothetical protein